MPVIHRFAASAGDALAAGGRKIMASIGTLE